MQPAAKKAFKMFAREADGPVPAGMINWAWSTKMSTFEVQLSAEFLSKIESDLSANVKSLTAANAFTEYNRGGGPAGSYDRHYDKSTGVSAQSNQPSIQAP
jgi:hypothetical protein